MTYANVRGALTILLLAFVGARSPSAGAAEVAKTGKPAPAFVIETPSGDEITARTFKGRPLVMNVFASWCPPCRAELPLIAAASSRAGTSVRFLGVDEQEAVAVATAFAKEMKLPYPIAIDNGQFAASYGAASLPETIFVDASGRVRAIVRGTIDRATLDRNLALIAN